jgi:hypothetical protein
MKDELSSNQTVNQPIPWRPLTALALALVAQFLLEPPAHGWLSLALYLPAIGLAVWSFVNGEWVIASRADEPAHVEPQTVRVFPLLISLPLLGVAFYLFDNNRFTLINLLLWLAGMILFIYAFRVRTKRSASRVDWKWIALIAICLAFTVFFRFHRSATMPKKSLIYMTLRAARRASSFRATPAAKHFKCTGRFSLHGYLARDCRSKV